MLVHLGVSLRKWECKALTRSHLSLVFFRLVNKRGPLTKEGYIGRCRVWKGAKSKGGYGLFSIRGKLQLAHRVSWAMNRGKNCAINMLHKCDSRSCVRPSHFFEGSFAANSKDMVLKRRDCFKITLEQAREIRSMTGKQSEIAKAFSVHPATICRIKSRKQRAHA